MRKIKFHQAIITICLILGTFCLCLVESQHSMIVTALVFYFIATAHQNKLDELKQISSNAGEDRPE